MVENGGGRKGGNTPVVDKVPDGDLSEKSKRVEGGLCGWSWN